MYVIRVFLEQQTENKQLFVGLMTVIDTCFFFLMRDKCTVMAVILGCSTDYTCIFHCFLNQVDCLKCYEYNNKY